MHPEAKIMKTLNEVTVAIGKIYHSVNGVVLEAASNSDLVPFFLRWLIPTMAHTDVASKEASEIASIER